MWASNLSATGPNGCASNTAGSLTSAGYTQPFSYDTLDRLSSNDVGSYSYGSGLQETGTTAPLHAAVALVGRNYTATYDAGGNMVCRAPNSTLTCAPPAGQTATGQQLGYDAAGRLTSWQDGTESPPNVAITDAYDGEGNRVAQHVLSFGSAWTTAYLLGDTAETVEGSGTFTDYLAVPGVGTAVRVTSRRRRRPQAPRRLALAPAG